MGVYEGKKPSDFEVKLFEEAKKAFLFYDLVFVLVVGFIVYLYIKLTPFPNANEGFLLTMSFCLVSLFTFLLVKKIFRENYFFSKCEEIKKYVWDFKEFKYFADVNSVALWIIFIFTWLMAVMYTPGNIGDKIIKQEKIKAEQLSQEKSLKLTEFKTKSVALFEKLDCGEIKKYDAKAFDLCLQIQKAKENTKGSFAVSSKSLDYKGQSCYYNVVSIDKGNKFYLETVEPQSCDDYKIGQEVSVIVKPSVAWNNDNGIFSYSILLAKK